MSDSIQTQKSESEKNSLKAANNNTTAANDSEETNTKTVSQKNSEVIDDKIKTKKIYLVLTDQQYKSVAQAADNLRLLGIPVQPQALIQAMISNKNADEMTDHFLSTMRKLVNRGKKELRESKTSGGNS